MDKSKLKNRVIDRIGELDPVSVQNFIQLLSREHGFLNSLFNSIQEAVLVVSSAHTILYHNAAAKKMLGLPDQYSLVPIEKILPGMNWNLLFGGAGDGKGASMRQELELHYPERRIVQAYALPVEREDAPYALILNDITESMNRAADHAESERSKMISLLAAGVAHEIGNPLNSLYLHLQFLQRLFADPDFDRAEASEELKDARGEVERLDAIINQFLRALRPGKPRLAPLDLKSLVLESLHFIRHEIADRKIQLDFYWDENVPRVNGDAVQLKQAFYNLVKNAFQSMPSGGHLSVRCSADDSFVMLSVSDSGRGIAKEDREKIFQPYFTTKPGGNGLGLMIVERIVREHGGSLALDSEPGQGATFTISLPRLTRIVRGLPAPENVRLPDQEEDKTK